MRTSVLTFALLTVTLLATSARAEDLPVNLQIQLLSKMATSIPNLTPVGTDPIKILVVYPGKADAPSRGAQGLQNTIKQVGKFGAYDTRTTLVAFVDANQLRSVQAAEKAQLIYLAPEFDEKGVLGVVEAFSDTRAVTVASASDHAKLGIVLGFSLVEARPRVLVNLKQANKQKIEFRNKLLTFAVIVDR